MTYESIIIGSWAVFILVWIVFSFGVKRDVLGGVRSVWYRYFLLRLALVAFIIFVAQRITTKTPYFANAPSAIFNNGIFTPPLVLGWVAAMLVVLGILFAIWARVHLGTNWSPAPAVKENHELVTSGPYRFVRHPIYTGILLAAFGVALTGTAFGIGMFLVISVIFFLRISKEEKIMLELFPAQYPEYKQRTRALVPFVW